MKTQQLDHVALHVQNLAASCAWYERVLQLEPLERPAFDFEGAWYRLGERQQLHLIAGRTLDVSSHSRSNHFALLVDDVDAWQRHLMQVGAEPARRTRPDLAYQIFLRDPDGHTIELCTLPGAAR